MENHLIYGGSDLFLAGVGIYFSINQKVRAYCKEVFHRGHEVDYGLRSLELWLLVF
jgi:hypothetical protein